MPHRVTLVDLDAPGGYVGSVAILDAPGVQVRELDGTPVLA